ncbi:hypothetical protein TWF730_000855 [Orbilia blumenaviensis]|uniref:Histone H4 n=1 Tax=Orbilia blumenaviensis TaxID=1796055 RepID=A0AAV9VMW9_9PEZI
MPPGRNLAGRNAPARGPTGLTRTGGMPPPRPIGSSTIAFVRGSATSTPTRPAQAASASLNVHRVFRVPETAAESSRIGASGSRVTLSSIARKTPAGHPVPGRGKGGKGLGVLSMNKRHRKILRDNIQGITRPAIRRLARRGGVKRISASIYEEARKVIKDYLKPVIQSCVMYTEHARRKTVTTSDVVHALNIKGRTIYGFDDPSSSRRPKKLRQMIARR